MGPQLYRCGNMARERQFGRELAVLQWGRNFIVAEIWQRRLPGDRHAPASMGPQLYRCGNANGLPPLALLSMLQWGRNFIVVEMCPGYNDQPPSRLGLQWGRNFIVAEILLLLVWWHTVLSSFNGAATLSLRK